LRGDAWGTGAAMRAYLKTRTLPWFLLAAVIGIVALLVLHGQARDFVCLAGLLVMLGAAIRYVGLAVRDDPVRTAIMSRDGLIGGVAGGIASMSAEERARRRRRR
jgi:hypothetical protein